MAVPPPPHAGPDAPVHLRTPMLRTPERRTVMRRLLPPLLCTALALAGGLAVPASTRAAESPFAGTWKASILLPPVSYHLWLVQIEDKDGKPNASIAASGLANQLPDPKIGSIRLAGDSLHLTI